jgi:hypothetical protein
MPLTPECFIYSSKRGGITPGLKRNHPMGDGVLTGEYKNIGLILLISGCIDKFPIRPIINTGEMSLPDRKTGLNIESPLRLPLGEWRVNAISS